VSFMDSVQGGAFFDAPFLFCRKYLEQVNSHAPKLSDFVNSLSKFFLFYLVCIYSLVQLILKLLAYDQSILAELLKTHPPCMMMKLTKKYYLSISVGLISSKVYPQTFYITCS